MNVTNYFKKIKKFISQIAWARKLRNYQLYIHRAFKSIAVSNKKFTYSKRFAFLVHEPMMYVHYESVWKALGKENFIIVTTNHCFTDSVGNKKLGTNRFMESIEANNYEMIDVETVLSSGKKFEYSISNHIISGSTTLEGPGHDTYLPCLVGKNRIRFMYGADLSDGWSLQRWNEIYDYFLCHGINDERELRKRFKGQTYVMGYPRYDRYFSEDIDLRSISKEFSIDPKKKTLLWMPTLGGEYSSIPIYAEPLSSLQKNFNIIIRPHPISFVSEIEYINLLDRFKFQIDSNPLRDMNELFKLADIVLADNGGTPFSAIFLGKNLIFLDVPEDVIENSDFTNYFKESSVMQLKKHLPALKQDQVQTLADIANSEEFYTENTKTIEMLFKSFFDSPRGGGAMRVAEIFTRLP